MISVFKSKKKNESDLLRTSKRRLSRKVSMNLQCYALLAFPIIGFFVFTIYPTFWAIFKSFYYYTGVPSLTRFTGFENFANIFKDSYYWNAWLTTLKFMVFKLPFEIMLALVIAVILSGKLKGSSFFRTSYYVPCVISVAITGVIFTSLFGYFGVINSFLSKIGLMDTPLDWFSSSGSALWVLVIGSAWMGFGINVVYFSAAMSNVPREVYEAAEIDGAGPITKFFRITIPMIAPVFQTILLLAINGTLQTGDYVIAMTNGAPGGSTHTAVSYIISEFLPGFMSSGATTVNIGYGCAMSLISSVIFGLVAFIYMKASKKMSEVY